MAWIRAQRLGALLLSMLIPAAAATAQNILDLPIGDPARAGKRVALLLDGITDTHDGAVLSPGQLADRLRDTDLLFIGESHTSIDFHRVQLQVVRALAATGRPVLVGLEMYPVTEQSHLDAWVAERPEADSFVTSSRWYEHWGYHWGYYEEIFVFARDHALPMYALNAPRDVVSAVRRKGIDGLSPEEASFMPPSIDLDSAEHLRLFKAYVGGEGSAHPGMTDEQWQSMFAAQCTWDAAMGYNAVRALQRHGEPGAIMVVLIGSGHVAYGLGIERQARNFFDGATATLIPVPTADADGHAVSTVRASHADYLWGIPAEGEPLYPSLGVSTSEREGEDGLSTLFVQPGTPADDAGVEGGDVLLQLNGLPLNDKESYNRMVAEFRWGDVVELTLQRGGETIALSVPLRRQAR